MADGSLRSASIQTAALVGSYLPRQCGIATFSKDLRDAVAAETGQLQASVIAIDDNAAGYAYPDEVRFQIPQHKQVEYISAADLLNVNQIDCVLLQHEYRRSTGARTAARFWILRGRCGCRHHHASYGTARAVDRQARC